MLDTGSICDEVGSERTSVPMLVLPGSRKRGGENVKKVEGIVVRFGTFWGAVKCSGGSLAGLLGSLGVLWVSLGRPLVPQRGLFVSSWRPFGVRWVSLGGGLGAPRWSFGWLVGGFLAPLVP